MHFNMIISKYIMSFLYGSSCAKLINKIEISTQCVPIVYSHLDEK